MGRLIQTVKPLHTPQQKDLVQWATYDELGRVSKQYLPYPAQNTTAGAFIPFEEALNAQQAFYGAEGDYAFSQNFYDHSPLNKIEKQVSAGAAWHARPVQQKLKTNTEAVHSWQYTASSYRPVTYLPHTLYRSETTDENGVTARVYTDRQGRTLLAEQATHATRYVYDELDRLRAVVPPGVDSPADRERCFFYNYDKRGRTIAQKTPGSGWAYAVYDQRNHKVMTADANQMSKGIWTWQTYDELNRPTRTEEVQLMTPYPPDRVQHLYDNSTEMPFTKRTLLAETIYDIHPKEMGVDHLAFKENGIVTSEQLAASNKGRVTMDRVRVLHVDPKAAAQYLTAAYYYDDRGRLVQSVTENILGGVDRISTAYLFSGAVDRTLQESAWRNIEDETDTLRLLTAYTYDALQRPLATTLAINDEQPVTVSEAAYDELLRVKAKHRHGKAETIEYAYNIKSWLTVIRSNLFTEELFYEKPLGEAAPRYNGDITGMRWRTARQGTRAYAFTYDDLSRLVNSQFAAGSEQWADNYTEKLTYDDIGRVQTLERYAGKGLKIDDLVYTYIGAHLQEIHDVGTPASIPVGSTTYSYDFNGNMTFESSTQIAYNPLDLPQQIRRLGGRSLKNTYTADGRKLIVDAQYTKGGYEAYRSYSGNLVFDMNDNLDYIVIPEGRILYNADDSTFTFEYHLRDHLGNVRVAFVPEKGVVQENAYYPFGGEIDDFSYSSNGWVENKLRYNSKELLGEYDLGWYDYGSRYYNPMLGMFMSVDPQAYRGYSWSPYAYCLNNPMFYVDPDGEWVHIVIGAAIGGVINLVSNAIQGNIHNFGDGLAA